MQELLEFFHYLHSAEGIRAIVQGGGLVALVAIVFSETGLLVGFFLPGDSLLVTAGIFTASDGSGGEPLFNLYALLGLLIAAAVIGDQTGYLLGRKGGRLIFRREDSFFFKKRYVEEAHAFYLKHGPSAIVLARFVPILRTFVPFTAGVAEMEYKKFVRYNVLGGVGWVASMILVGHFLGKTQLANELQKIILVVVVLSLLPLVHTIVKGLRSRSANS